MKFFIPRAETPEQAIAVRVGVQKHLTDILGAHFDSRRVFRLRHTHDGREYKAQVGRVYDLTDEEVLLILHEPGRNLCHVDTPAWGVVRGQSILVGDHDVHEYQNFEDD